MFQFLLMDDWRRNAQPFSPFILTCITYATDTDVKSVKLIFDDYFVFSFNHCPILQKCGDGEIFFVQVFESVMQ